MGTEVVMRQLIQRGVMVAVDYISSQMVSTAKPKDLGPVALPVLPPAERVPEAAASAEPGCPMCQVHRELAEARSLMEGLAVSCQAHDEVPKHLGSTLLLVQSCLTTARGKLKDVQARAPLLTGESVRLEGAIAEAERAIPRPEEATPEKVADAAGLVTQCWKRGYILSDHFFGGHDRAAHGEMSAGELYRQVRAGTMTEDEFAARMKEL